MSLESLIIWLVVGAVAGWLGGLIVKGDGSGLIGNIIIGILGAFIGGWLLDQLGVHVWAGILGTVFSATVGAVVLLLVIRVLRRA
jgi:uncharacterized membrane protein YeaQ/YmgE (transglycosylase-associated protein family)